MSLLCSRCGYTTDFAYTTDDELRECEECHELFDIGDTGRVWRTTRRPR